MVASPNLNSHAEAVLQLLLFVDRRGSSQEELERIRQFLRGVEADGNFALEVIDVGEQPYLAEHFKLIATPTLIKIHPEPRQTLTGSNLVSQLERVWERWQQTAADYLERCRVRAEEGKLTVPSRLPSIASSAEIIQLSDEVFRLKQENKELQEHLRFKDRLMSMLAHDLRNPLTSTSIALETIETLRHPDNQDKLAANPALLDRLLQHARAQTREIEQMILDVLETARSDDGYLSIHPQKVDLAELCRDTLAKQQDLFETRSLRLDTDIPKDIPAVYADASRVRQVLTNLLDNAAKYTPEGGTVSLALLHRTSQKIQVSINDTGPGIPLDQQKHIFGDRVRLERDEKTSGYGLGLSLCQRVVRSHYGKIWVDSMPGRGSTFHFTLPVYRH